MAENQSNPPSFTQRLADGETVLIAEGFLFELERRGYLQCGSFAPEVVLEHPDKVRDVHEDFVHAGSDIVLAFTYYGHREKLRLIGREADLEVQNRKALQIAREVADKTGTLMAGNICNTTVYDPDKPESFAIVEAMFKEQIEWINEGKADLIIAETFPDYGEAKLALQCIQKYSDLPSIVNIAPYSLVKTRDGYTYAEACRLLEDQGATVVGLNCSSGPETMAKLMRDVRKACKGPLCALPVPYRTNDKYPLFQNLKLPNGETAFPTGLDYHYSTRHDFYQFGLDCKEIGIQVPGICCGNSARHFRSLAEGVGRTPPASRYSADMSKHYIYGTHPSLRKVNTQTLKDQIDAAGVDTTTTAS